MTLDPARLPASAVELHDDDGQPAATIYARRFGLEIVCAAGWSLQYEIDTSQPQRLGVALTHDNPGEHPR